MAQQKAEDWIAARMSLQSDLILLQGKVKEDPEIYRDDAMKHFKHFLTLYEIFQLKPSKGIIFLFF